MGRSSFGKLSRDRAKKAKAQAKREKRQAAAETVEVETEAAPVGEELSAADLLQRIEDVHRRYDAGEMSEDDFQEAKADLLGRLPID